MDKKSIKNGGIYLVNYSGNITPEFGMKHFSVLIKTTDSEIFLSFPITSKIERMSDKSAILCPHNNDYVILLKHVRPVSFKRVIAPQTINGINIILNERQLIELFTGYDTYCLNIKNKSIVSVRNYHNHKHQSKNKMKLICYHSININCGDSLSPIDCVKEYTNGKLSILNNISTKMSGEYIINVQLKDKYGHKIIRKVNVIVNDN
ncbi:hypothetical protein [Breznakia pachnodae]|uniref:Pesticidal crystal protein Cry22Aa Ig-like domain-containing protein n=1 Tax=Breznakia pachnodae TaxID=265178 RepID=A0ABU0DZS8_9FIRM|nr:hypothetical protein [Breznakia pachnodae]MDQ0360133.1 hypothetical protein [Breznakia pachnodae]